MNLLHLFQMGSLFIMPWECLQYNFSGIFQPIFYKNLVYLMYFIQSLFFWMYYRSLYLCGRDFLSWRPMSFLGCEVIYLPGFFIVWIDFSKVRYFSTKSLGSPFYIQLVFWEILKEFWLLWCGVAMYSRIYIFAAVLFICKL